MRKTLFLLCASALAGCGSNAPDTRVIQLPVGGTIVETVNGTAVPQSLLEAVARQHNWHLDQPQQRDQALKVLTDTVLVAQAAQREDLLGDSEFQADVEAARLKGVADSSMLAFERRTPISDAVLRAEYDTQVARTGKMSYDFTQLLFASEDDALKAEADVLAGKPFQQVYDAWRGKAKQARAFTRVRLDQVPEELGKVLGGMHNDETTKTPVKTQFGWHVVHLDIANPYTPPEFDQVKEGIRRNLQLKIGKERLDKLKEQAKIEYPPGVAPPAEPAKPAVNAPAAPAGEKPEAATPAEKKG
jgi:peptidyl-prolyl cis-trans isomerase C